MTPGEKFEDSQKSDSEAEHEPDDLKVDFLDNLNLENLLNDSDIAEETELESPEVESSENLTYENKRRIGEGIYKKILTFPEKSSEILKFLITKLLTRLNIFIKKYPSKINVTVTIAGSLKKVNWDTKLDGLNYLRELEEWT